MRRRDGGCSGCCTERQYLLAPAYRHTCAGIESDCPPGVVSPEERNWKSRRSPSPEFQVPNRQVPQSYDPFANHCQPVTSPRSSPRAIAALPPPQAPGLKRRWWHKFLQISLNPHFSRGICRIRRNLQILWSISTNILDLYFFGHAVGLRARLASSPNELVTRRVLEHARNTVLCWG